MDARYCWHVHTRAAICESVPANAQDVSRHALEQYSSSRLERVWSHKMEKRARVRGDGKDEDGRCVGRKSGEHIHLFVGEVWDALAAGDEMIPAIAVHTQQRACALISNGSHERSKSVKMVSMKSHGASNRL